MSNLIEKYLHIKEKYTYNESDELIRDCFRFGIFKLKPSRKHKYLFRKRYKTEYPVYTEQLNKALLAELEKDVRLRELEAERKKDAAFARKCARQRAGRGFSDRDVWNFCDWFIEVVRPMLQQLRATMTGFPMDDEIAPGYWHVHTCCSEEAKEQADAEARQRWEGILERMIFLLGEMDEDSCSMKNRYDDELERIKQDFTNKYGLYGDGLKTPERLEREKKCGYKLPLTPRNFPDLYPDYEELSSCWSGMEHDIYVYRMKCKDEFFALFAKHFWYLWD